MSLHKLTVLIVFIIFSFQAKSQLDSTEYIFNADTTLYTKNTNNLKRNNPQIATLLSIVPGAGQVYNRQYWKIPIFYGLLGYQAYNFSVKNKKFHKYLYALGAKQRNDTEYIFPADIKDLTNEQLTQYKDKYRRSRDLSFVLFIAIWGFNIMDANVYAHLYNFDISEDLSIRIRPEIIPTYAIKNENVAGLTIQFKF